MHSPKAFFFATARNLVCDHYRKLRVTIAGPLGAFDEISVLDETVNITETVARNQEIDLAAVENGGLVTAYDARTGEEVYVQERAAATGRYYASPVAANGNIYFTSLDDGAVTVLKAGTVKPEVLAKNPGLGERVAATPAIADNALYIRSEKHLYAFGDKK